MKYTNIKRLILGIIAEIILLIFAFKLYQFMMASDGVEPGTMFLNALLFIALCVLAIVNYMYVIWEVELDW
jgi:hypothetical protein